MARFRLGGGAILDDEEEMVESSEGGIGRTAPGQLGAPYARKEAWPFVLTAVVVVGIVAGTILYVGWLNDVWGTSSLPLEDVRSSGVIELRADGAGPVGPYGPHVLALNLTLGPGDLVLVDVTSVGPVDGVEVFIQHPLHPVNASAMPAVVWSMGSGPHVELRLRTTEPGAYQVYIVHPGAVRPPPAGVDPFDWRVPAQVTWSVIVTRAD